MTEDDEKQQIDAARRALDQALAGLKRLEGKGRPGEGVGANDPAIHEPTAPFCSFCGKGKNEVRQMVAGPGVWICNECVALCQDIMSESGRSA